MKRMIIWGIVFVLLVCNLVSADYFYTPMNFDEPTNHSFQINLDGNISVSIPSNFTLISGNLTGTNNINFVIQSPNLVSDEPKLFVGSINLNSLKYADFYLLGVKDNKIVDTKVEVGHGDFNYIDSDGYIGTDNTLLFNLVRVWAMGSDIIDEPARNVRFNCTYPLIIPNTVDSKYTTTYNTNNITAEGNLVRMEGMSMFRVFVLSQQVEYPENSNYEVSCGKLYYDFSHTEVIADIPEFNLSVRKLDPLVINMNNNSGYVTYTILNDELYDLKDLEFTWTIGTHNIIKNLGSLNSGDFIQFNIKTNESGDISLKVRFIPEWMFNSRSPLFYEQTIFNTYDTPTYLNGLNSSLFYNNQSVLTTPILETQSMKFSINILQNPPFGDAFKINYLFYNKDGLLKADVNRQIIGINNHTISFTNLDLKPQNLKEDFDVYSIVSIKDSTGNWYEFPEKFIGVQSIVKLTDNGAKNQIGLYDVIVTTKNDKYLSDDRITAEILIKNTGDTPDKDTILTYYLIGPDGERFGETKEQILEVPVGSTILTRSITLPSNSNIGEWEFHSEYETVVQPTIEVYDSFEVVTGMSILERSHFDNFSKHNWLIIWIIILIIIIIDIILRKRRKKKK